VGNERLRTLDTRELEPFSAFSFSGPIIEQIGNTQHFFLPTILFFCDGECVDILCNYSDSIIQADFNQDQCDIALESIYNPFPDLTLQPNPAHQTINIISSFKGPLYRVRIFDAMHHLVETVNTSGEIDLIGLVPGLYFIQLEINSKLSTFKIIKQ
jgi:hypothetical protein